MTKITGHRGARNLWPENSLTGFRNAVQLGIDAVEFDIHLSRAGELLVIHDATLDRTTETTGPVADLTPEARRNLRLQDSDEGIPLLSEMLGFLAGVPGIELHVELKADADGQPYAGLEALVAEEIRRHGLAGRSLMTSFNPAVLETCRTVAPEIARLISMTEDSAARFGGFDSLLTRSAELVRTIAVHHAMFEARLDAITAAVPLDRLCVWTLNEAPLIQRWLDRGVGWITTDRPDIGLDLRRR